MFCCVVLDEQMPGVGECSVPKGAPIYKECSLANPRLHKTFQDAECLYMLTEACLHGDLYSLLKDKYVLFKV